MSEFKKYLRTAVAEMVDWTPDFDMSEVSVSVADLQAGSPMPGDKIARNPANHADKWLVSAEYFAANFELMPTTQYVVEGGIRHNNADADADADAAACVLSASLEDLLAAMYAAEINFHISMFFDEGIKVVYNDRQLDAVVNYFNAVPEAAAWLREQFTARHVNKLTPLPTDTDTPRELR